MADTPRFDVLWPLARKRILHGVEPSSIADLSGKVVAEIWDYLFQGEEVFARLREHLRARYPGIRFVGCAEFGDIHGPDERNVVAALPAKLKAMGCDAAIVGIGA